MFITCDKNKTQYNRRQYNSDKVKLYILLKFSIFWLRNTGTQIVPLNSKKTLEKWVFENIHNYFVLMGNHHICFEVK